MIAMTLGLVSFFGGELLYDAGKRTLAALLWLACLFAFYPSGFTLLALNFYFRGWAFGFWLALLFAAGLLVGCGVAAWRYFSFGNGERWAIR